MKRCALIQYLCVFLLLVAQQGALTHALWHAGHAVQAHAHVHEHSGAHDASHDGSHDDERPSIQSTLCAFDLAFGQVLGGAHACGMALAHVPVTVERIHDLTAPRLAAEALSPKSRGPPALL